MKAILIRISTQEILKKANYPKREIKQIEGLDADLEWLLVVEQERPIYDAETQKLEKVETITDTPHPVYDFVNIYDITYNVIALSQEEIDAHEKSKEDNDASAQKVSNFKANGQREHKRIWDRIMRLYDNGQLNDTQFNAISDLLFDALLPLELGLWKVAQSRVDALPVGTGILATIRTTVKGIIDDYVIANY